MPFLSTLGCVARQSITSIAVVKRVLPAVGQEFEKAKWRAACAYMVRELVVPRLRLVVGVVGAAQPEGGWGDVPELTVEQFRLVQPRSIGRRSRLGLNEVGGVDFEWVQQLIWLRGLREILFRELLEYDIRPVSDDWVFSASFSNSIERSFRAWVEGLMI